MIKLKKIVENSFEGGVSGTTGTLNYSTPWGTSQGGNVTQNPSKFSSSDKTVNHFASDTTGSAAVPKLPDRNNQNKSITPNTLPSPAGKADQVKASKPLNPDNEFSTKVDQLFTPDKKYTPTPDEILSGINTELGKMVKKDKTIAKQIVLKNLKNDPKYYSSLQFLNIDDKKMKVDEITNTTYSKTKDLLDKMVSEKKNQVIPDIPNLKEIFDDLTTKRNYR